jgi:hypothetical protein
MKSSTPIVLLHRLRHSTMRLKNIGTFLRCRIQPRDVREMTAPRSARSLASYSRIHMQARFHPRDASIAFAIWDLLLRISDSELFGIWWLLAAV